MTRKPIDPARRIEIGRERRLRTRAKIVSAAFEVFGEAEGLYARIEDVAERAEVTRATFYNHFNGMAELRDALTFEVTHDFLDAVTSVISRMPNARDRSASAVRFYLKRARTDLRWAWSMINLSATGRIFGEETFRQAEQTLREGVEEGSFSLSSVELGRDLLLGTTLAAMAAIARDGASDDYPEEVARGILFALGVPPEDARICAFQPLPALGINTIFDKMPNPA